MYIFMYTIILQYILLFPSVLKLVVYSAEEFAGQTEIASAWKDPVHSSMCHNMYIFWSRTYLLNGINHFTHNSILLSRKNGCVGIWVQPPGRSIQLWQLSAVYPVIRATLSVVSATRTDCTRIASGSIHVSPYRRAVQNVAMLKFVVTGRIRLVAHFAFENDAQRDSKQVPQTQIKLLMAHQNVPCPTQKSEHGWIQSGRSSCKTVLLLHIIWQASFPQIMKYPL
jgi:hypothetical protein